MINAISDLRVSQSYCQEIAPLLGVCLRDNSGRPCGQHPCLRCFDVDFRDDHGRGIIFVVRRRTLAFSLGTGPSVLPSTKAWEDWGPHWMELDFLNDSISLAGLRCVLREIFAPAQPFLCSVCATSYRVRTRGATANYTLSSASPPGWSCQPVHASRRTSCWSCRSC
ncbi:hypothetical protein BC826DRAFT_567861 [Russula brevipes]|nr:hypothetical protein BC826DRAFT_567861 [Russula brevipes]